MNNFEGRLEKLEKQHPGFRLVQDLSTEELIEIIEDDLTRRGIPHVPIKDMGESDLKQLIVFFREHGEN